MTRAIRKIMVALGLRRRSKGDQFRDLGDKARDRGDWLDAVFNYRNYLTANPESFPIWVQLGHASKEAGDATAAEQAYTRALSLKPADADLLLNLGHLMKVRGRVGEAVEYYTRSAATDTTGNALRELSSLGRAPTPELVSEVEATAAGAPAPDPFLRGAVVLPREAEGPRAVSLLEGGVEIARTLLEGEGRQRGFSLRLPAEVCDGRPHGFEVAVEGEIVARAATITPASLTPGAILADHAARPERATLSIAARWRYAALAERLEQQGEALGLGAPSMQDLGEAHRFLVEGPVLRGLEEHYAPLAFPRSARPDVSVVVPVHNKFAFTYRCLASLLLMPNDCSIEVIVVDDGSSDQTREIEALVEGIVVVRHETATGFVGACNDGASAATGRYVVLLNNDTEVSPHWADRLIEPFDLYDDVGLVGAKLIFGDGRLQEAGGIVWRDGRAANYGRLGSVRDPRYNFLRDTDYCSGACIALRREVWEDLGGFDSAFAPAYYEDTDLAFRVRAKGLRVLYQPACEILHFEGVSNGIDVASGLKRFQAINEPKFLERWGGSLRANGDSHKADAVEAERGYPRRALIIDIDVPQPDRSAGHHAAIQEIRLLQSLGYRAVFLPLNLAYLGRYNDLLARMGVEAICAPFVLSAEEFLSQRGKDFDLVYVTRYSVAEDVLPLVRRYCPEAKVVFNNADLHFLRAIRDALESGEKGDLAAAAQVREAELSVMRRVDLTLSYNVVEHAVIESHTMGDAKVGLCPWVLEPRDLGPGFAEREGLAFLGGYRHPPNRRAVEFFVTEVMPHLRKRRSGIRFHIYGSFVPPEFARFAAEDVVIEGYVDRVEDALDRARLFVAPLRSGAGIKGKVLEALASGVPSILSPIAAEGTGIRSGLEAIVADTPDEWADAIVRLHEDEAGWSDMRAAAGRFVADRYSFERGRDIMRQALNAEGITTLSGMVCRTIPPLSR